MSILQGIYGIGVHDSWYRSKLKKKVEAAFPDQLYFVTAKANTSEIALNANKVSLYVAPINESNIVTAVNIITKIYSSTEQTKPAWPPTTEQFSTSERNIPESVYLF